LSPDALTKSGIILGLGEEWDEIVRCLRDLRRSDVDIVTLGQYLRPSDGHLPIARITHHRNSTSFAPLGWRSALPTYRQAR
jgi:lipoic acid synthetase